jgi:hypothetical protein
MKKDVQEETAGLLPQWIVVAAIFICVMCGKTGWALILVFLL